MCKMPMEKSTDPHDIPNGYSEDLHKNLKCTIAEEGDVRGSGRAMACHESKDGNNEHCVGWLFNQLGPGNNIGLRIQMMSYDLKNAKTVGPQHLRFEDTLPKKKRKKKVTNG